MVVPKKANKEISQKKKITLSLTFFELFLFEISFPFFLKKPDEKEILSWGGLIRFDHVAEANF